MPELPAVRCVRHARYVSLRSLPGGANDTIILHDTVQQEAKVLRGEFFTLYFDTSVPIFLATRQRHRVRSREMTISHIIP